MRFCLISIMLFLFFLPNTGVAVPIGTSSAQSNKVRGIYQAFQEEPLTTYNRSHPSDQYQESRIETFSISMPQLGDRQRDIQVYLPPDYDSSDASYPVFYLHDGAFLFNPPPNGIGDYGIDETLDRLFFEDSLGGIIVVGIEYAPDHPWDEYMPWINENMHDWLKSDNIDSVAGGEGFSFIDFIVKTLKPEIDLRYRTLPDREHTAIGGFCRGALFPLVAGLAYPEVFSQVMAMSPAVWMAEGGGRWLSNNQLINYINDNTVPDDVKFYIDIGTQESSGSRPPVKDQDGNRITYPQAYLEGAEIVYKALKNNGVPEHNLYFQIIEGVAGKRDVWATRFDDAVLWLKGKVEIPPLPSLTSTPVRTSTTPSKFEPVDRDQKSFPTILNENKLIFGVILGWLLLLAIVAVVQWRLKQR